MMRAIEISHPGGPDVLRLVDRPMPEPRAGDVLVRVAAAGVNRPDVMQRQGKYPPPPGASDLPGLEIAGTIVAMGADPIGCDGSPLAMGQEVCALVAGGGYAEFCVAPAPQCLPVPRGLDVAHAAALPETFFTVWTNLFERGRLSAGETALVHGGTSGIGTTAIQLARAFGARVFATAATREKCAACERLGAERGINHRDEDFVAVVRELTGGAGVDVILDIVGGAYTARNLDALAPHGRLVIIGFMGGAKAELNLLPILQKRLTITGSTLRPRTVAEKGAIAHALLRHVWPLVERGTVSPIVHATFPLERAADAHRLMESSGHVGKIVLTMERLEA
jgi:putative PIG3 family NAD(P)H quinone oxidoreductase